jgi:glycosyltransferase involved in cell wall biosynthesis
MSSVKTVSMPLEALGLRRYRTAVVLVRQLGNSFHTEISVVVPMFCREGRVHQVMNHLAVALRLPAEVIIVDDASHDNTMNEVLDWTNSLRPSDTTIRRVVVLRNKWAHFETYCDVVGFEVALSPYLLEMQADMLVTEVGFDQRLVCALQAHSDLLAVSGRGVHLLSDVEVFPLLPWVFSRRAAKIFSAALRRTPVTRATQFWPLRLERIFPAEDRFVSSGRAGRLGRDIEQEFDLPPEAARQIWVGETIMRGPLALDRVRYRAIGGLDSRKFFLGNDDHDLCARARAHGYRVGFVPIKFTSQLTDGTSRQKRSRWARFRIATLTLRQGTLFAWSGLAADAKLPRAKKPFPEIRHF